MKKPLRTGSVHAYSWQSLLCLKYVIVNVQCSRCQTPIRLWLWSRLAAQLLMSLYSSQGWGRFHFNYVESGSRLKFTFFPIEKHWWELKLEFQFIDWFEMVLTQTLLYNGMEMTPTILQYLFCFWMGFKFVLVLFIKANGQIYLVSGDPAPPIVKHSALVQDCKQNIFYWNKGDLYKKVVILCLRDCLT